MPADTSSAQAISWKSIPVRQVILDEIIIGEHAENEMRKDFTISERVAIGREVEIILGDRRGFRTDIDPTRYVDPRSQRIAEVPTGEESRSVAAKRAGFGNSESYRQAKSVVDTGAPELVAALDAGDVAVSAGAQIAKLPVEAATRDRCASQPESDLGCSKTRWHRRWHALHPRLQIGFDFQWDRTFNQTTAGVAMISEAQIRPRSAADADRLTQRGED